MHSLYMVQTGDAINRILTTLATDCDKQPQFQGSTWWLLPDSCFTILVEVFTNLILAGSTYFTNHIEWTEHKIMVIKSANNQIIQELA